MSIPRDKEGRFDQWQVPVEWWEIGYAQSRNQRAYRSDVATRYCIAFGKCIGTYDPAPSRAWWEARRQP